MAANRLISIVDDDDAARTAVAGLVRAMGYDTAEFGSAADFLQSDHLFRTSCLIADMRMPEMTGLQLYRHLASSTTPIPTILITAYANEDARNSALQAGIRCYLAKPVVPEQLLDCIRSSLALAVEYKN